jgi:hypothetical protein
MSERPDRDSALVTHQASQGSERSAAPAWQRPRFSVIPLDCEISAYAPAGDDPLF